MRLGSKLVFLIEHGAGVVRESSRHRDQRGHRANHRDSYRPNHPHSNHINDLVYHVGNESGSTKTGVRP